MSMYLKVEKVRCKIMENAFINIETLLKGDGNSVKKSKSIVVRNDKSEWIK